LLEPVLAQLQEKYPDDVRLVFRNFPINNSEASRLMAQATEAAGKQDQFFEMKDILFAQQETWKNKPIEEIRVWLVEKAEEIGLDSEKFSSDIDSKDVIDRVDRAYQSATDANLGGTPYLLINGQPMPGYLPFESLESIFLLQKRQFTECPPFAILPDRNYSASLITTQGTVDLELFPKLAPITVNNFIFLAREDWYDENLFSLQPGVAVLAGDPTNTGLGNPGFFYDLEENNMKFDKPGMLGMFNQGPNSNGSIFFISLQPLPDLDGRFTIFGQVRDGMEMLNSLSAKDTLLDVLIKEE
jgi:cyclophilin family peptidyl-prolyl cis-trans isomerase